MKEQETSCCSYLFFLLKLREWTFLQHSRWEVAKNNENEKLARCSQDTGSGKDWDQQHSLQQFLFKSTISQNMYSTSTNMDLRTSQTLLSWMIMYILFKNAQNSQLAKYLQPCFYHSSDFFFPFNVSGMGAINWQVKVTVIINLPNQNIKK